MSTLNSLQLAYAAAQVYDDLLHFIEEGLYDYGRRRVCETEFALLKGRLAEKMTRALGIYPSKALPFTPAVLQEGYRLTYRRYLDSLAKCFFLDKEDNRAPFAYLPSRFPDAAVLITEVLGDLPEKQADPDTDLVRAAFNQAALNRQVARSRVAALFFLSGEAQDGRRDELISDAVHRILEVFYRQHDRFTLSWQNFAMLLGGDALATVRATLAKDYFSDGMSVMQYLERNEGLPGRWASDTEDRFRQSIAEYLKNPV